MSLGVCLYRSDKIADAHVMLTTAFDVFDETVCNPAPRFKSIADSGTLMKLKAIYSNVNKLYRKSHTGKVLSPDCATPTGFALIA